jgi:hypothetical protein
MQSRPKSKQELPHPQAVPLIKGNCSNCDSSLFALFFDYGRCWQRLALCLQFRYLVVHCEPEPNGKSALYIPYIRTPMLHCTSRSLPA